jgi:hypothetical protein
MYLAKFRFYESLNFFLPRRKKHRPIHHEFDWRASIKDMIESLGVPHAEVSLIVVNGKSVDFSYIVRPDDVVDVYPFFDMVELPEKVRLRPILEPHEARFVLDTHLGRLAAYLRMMGFDTLYRNDYADDELARVAHSEGRIVLTRDIGVLKRSLVTHGYFVRETSPRRRLVEIIRRFDLHPAITPFKHCMKCNGLLTTVSKESVASELPADTLRYYDEFHRCTSCQQIYWKGPHYERMRALIDEVLLETRQSNTVM